MEVRANIGSGNCRFLFRNKASYSLSGDSSGHPRASSHPRKSSRPCDPSPTANTNCKLASRPHRWKPPPGSLLTSPFSIFVHHLSSPKTFSDSDKFQDHGTSRYTYKNKYICTYLHHDHVGSQVTFHDGSAFTGFSLSGVSSSVVQYPTIGQKPDRLFTKMRSTSYNESSITPPQLNWKCDVPVCLSLSVMCVWMCAVVGLSLFQSLPFTSSVSASVATHQHMCGNTPQHMHM